MSIAKYFAYPKFGNGNIAKGASQFIDLKLEKRIVWTFGSPFNNQLKLMI